MVRVVIRVRVIVRDTVMGNTTKTIILTHNRQIRQLEAAAASNNCKKKITHPGCLQIVHTMNSMLPVLYMHLNIHNTVHLDVTSIKAYYISLVLCYNIYTQGSTPMPQWPNVGSLEWVVESTTVTHSSADWWDLLLPLA